MSKNYICPICGYDKLEEAPFDETGEPSFDICSCCGCEYGYDVVNDKVEIEKYRENWIKHGAKWFYEGDKPKNWSLEKQLKNIKGEENGIHG